MCNSAIIEHSPKSICCTQVAVTEARVSPEMASHQIINGHRNEEDYAKTVFGGKHHKGKFHFFIFKLIILFFSSQ